MKYLKKHGIPAVLLLLGSLVLLNATVAAFLSNLTTGIWMTYALGAVILLSGIGYRRLPRWWFCLLGVSLLLILVCISTLFLYGKTDTAHYDEDIVLILGAGIRGDQPGDNLKNRLDTAVAYYQQNPHALFVVSGGQGPQETVTEAVAMERYLIDCGIPASQILKEESATSTAENMRYTKALLGDRTALSITVITTDYHIYRAVANAGRVGWHHVSHCHSDTPWYLILPNGLRECLAIGKWWLLTT